MKKGTIVIIILSILFVLSLTGTTIFISIYKRGYEVPVKKSILKSLKKTEKVEFTSQDFVIITTTDDNTINEVIETINSARKTIKAGTVSTCEGSSLSLKMYDENDNIIETFVIFASRQESITLNSTKDTCTDRYYISNGKSLIEILKRKNKEQ